VKTLYLQRALSSAGQESLAGRLLADRMRDLSDNFVLSHVVRPEETSDPRYAQDVVSTAALQASGPDLIYVEGGFGYSHNVPRVPLVVVNALVQQGCVLIIADVDLNRALHERDMYQAIRSMTGATIDYGSDPDRNPDPVYGIDKTSYWEFPSNIVCRPERMLISDWLEPAYARVEELVVSAPVRLRSFESILASGNADTSGTLQSDEWVTPIEPFPFASVANRGNGYVVVIAANISHDRLARRCPDNLNFITDTARLLVAESKRNRERRRPKGPLH
jgi:hypothetical protein